MVIARLFNGDRGSKGVIPDYLRYKDLDYQDLHESVMEVSKA